MKRKAEEQDASEGEGDKKTGARYEQCEDDHHSGPMDDLRKCRKDGRVRCRQCRQDQKRLADAVGTRGLDLAAHFRSRQLKQRCLPAVEVIASSPDDEETQAEVSPQKPPQPAIVEPGKPLGIEEETTDVPNTSPSSPSVPKPPKKKGIPGKGVKCLHIGCDVCPRWFVVDQTLFDHWRDSKFTCCMVGEACSRKETHTALVACKGVPDMLSRLGKPARKRGSRPQMLPGGCWDVWRPDTLLSTKAPRIFAAPMTAISSKWRDEAQKLFEKGWAEEASQKSIHHLLNLHEEIRGRAARQSTIIWLLWQESVPEGKTGATGGVGTMLSVALLSRQHYTSKGPKELQGGMVLEYISVDPSSEAKAYWLVLAAQEVALLMGHTELFSACDLNQRGQAFDGRAKPALEAHRRWGFEDTDQKEWRDRRLEGYCKGCDVHYMVKVIGR